MARAFETLIDRLTQRRGVRRWRRAAEAAAHVDLVALRQLRGHARRLRRQIDRVIHVADGRLALPLIGSDTIQKPLGSDWGYRPQAWRGPLGRPGAVAVENGTRIGDEVTVFHDCRVPEITLRQLRNTREADLAPFGLRMDVFRFDGSFLSLAIDLPPEAVAGLERRHLIRLALIVEMERPLELFARLNVKHGPNVEQTVREIPAQGGEAIVDFDLAYTSLNEARVEKMWLDLIFEGPEMNEVILRDVALSRRPRLDL
jgi:hypothetical protein